MTLHTQAPGYSVGLSLNLETYCVWCQPTGKPESYRAFVAHSLSRAIERAEAATSRAVGAKLRRLGRPKALTRDTRPTKEDAMPRHMGPPKARFTTSTAVIDRKQNRK